MDSALVSVIIPTYRRAALLPQVLAAWFGQHVSEGAYELVVVNDGSDDGTAELLAEHEQSADGRLRVITQPNAGLAAARNRGIAASNGSVLLFSDDDMLPRDELVIERHLEAQRTGEGAWVSHCQVPSSHATTPFQAYWRRRLHAGTDRLARGADLGMSGFWFASLSLPRWLLAGSSFATNFKGYGWEEHELGYRLHRRGVRARFLQGNYLDHHDRVQLATSRVKFEAMGRAAWTFHGLHPTLQVALWTGTHPLSRLARRLFRQEWRGDRLVERGEEALSDAQYRAVLEASYARGLRLGETQHG